MAEDEPILVSFDQDAWANTLSYDLLDREQYLHLFKLLRTSMRPILDNLTSEQSRRVGIYIDQERFTFKQLLEFRVQHVRDHLDQIERVKNSYREKQPN